MTLLELVRHLRKYILDDTGGTGVDWETVTEDAAEASQLRWSNEELTSFINEAQKQACRNSLLIKEYNSSFDIAVTAGTAEYEIDPRIIRIKHAYLNSTGKELSKADIEELFEIQNWWDLTGTPSYYVADHNTGKITLFRKPTANDTVKLVVYRTQLLDFDWTLNSAEPDINERYHLPMLHYAAFMAYMKDEANTLDPKKAQEHLALFTQEFSAPNNAYAETQRQRRTKRGITYGGLSF